jgi:hypothetical protein
MCITRLMSLKRSPTIMQATSFNASATRTSCQRTRESHALLFTA